MAHAVRGFSLLLVYSGGFSAVCPISHFTASVRRFNVLGYPYTAAAPLVLWPLFMVIWRGVVPCSVACRLRCQLAHIVRRPCAPVTLWWAACSGGAVSVASGGGFAVRGAPPKPPEKSPGKSRKSLAKSHVPAPKSLILPQNHSRLQNSVYKGGIFLARFPGIDGKSCKSRSVPAHFASKSLASMYFCWSCSGVKPSICGWFGVKTISCLSTMP